MAKCWFRKHRIIRRAISVLSLFAFITSFVFTDAWPLVDTPDAHYKTTSQELSKFARLNIDTFTIPEHLGEVKFTFKGDPKKYIIHIQDAHANRFAQHKISDIIGYLNKEYGIRMVNLEGGVGDYDLAVFTSITGEAIRREVADYFVKKGEINGAEFYAINNPEKVTLWGIEDKDLYIANLKVYRNSLEYKEEVDKFLKELTHVLNNLKRHIFSPELLKIDIAYNSYKARGTDFREYVSFLIERAKEHRIDVKEFGNLYSLAQAMGMEEGIDFKKANRQRNVLIDQLKKDLSKNEVRQLVKKSIDFKTKKISRKHFYDYLLRKAKELDLKIDRFSALSSYIAYVGIYESVERSKVMEELDTFESEIKKPLYRNDTQRQLNKLSRNLALLKNIFDVLLTKTDYQYYLKNKDSFDINNFLEFIRKEAPKYKISARPSAGIVKLDDYRAQITKFYEYSFKRDKAFLKNIKFSPSFVGAASGREQRAAILMTGGFHTENLCQLLEKERISYISILPKFTSEKNYESPYFELLAGQTTNVQRMLVSVLAKTAMMAIASMLSSELGLAVYGKLGRIAFDIRVRWVTAIKEAEERGEEGGLKVTYEGEPIGIIDTEGNVFYGKKLEKFNDPREKEFDLANVEEIIAGLAEEEAPTIIVAAPAVIERSVATLLRVSPEETIKDNKTGATYVLTEQLGKGGEGIVFKAKTSDDRVVAIKILTIEISPADEFAVLQDLEGVPSVIKAESKGSTRIGNRDHKYLVTEYIEKTRFKDKKNTVMEARTLQDLLNNGYVFTASEIADIAIQLLKANNELKRKRLIHKDLKPANLFVESEDGRIKIKIGDFGLAQYTDSDGVATSEVIVGSPGYMPEKSFYGEYNTKTDLYAVGCILYVLLHGNLNHTLEWAGLKEGERSIIQELYKNGESEKWSIEIGKVLVEEMRQFQNSPKSPIESLIANLVIEDGSGFEDANVAVSAAEKIEVALKPWPLRILEHIRSSLESIAFLVSRPFARVTPEAKTIIMRPVGVSRMIPAQTGLRAAGVTNIAVIAGIVGVAIATGTIALITGLYFDPTILVGAMGEFIPKLIPSRAGILDVGEKALERIHRQPLRKRVEALIPGLTSDIAEGLDKERDSEGRTEAERWIEDLTIPPEDVPKAIKDEVNERCGDLLEQQMLDDIEAWLDEKKPGISQKVINMLNKTLSEEDTEFSSVSHFGWRKGWMKARVEGREKYLLGNKSVLAVNIVKYLKEKDAGLSEEERRKGLLAEYILHEALENIDELDHYDIIRLTSKVFDRKVDIDKLGPGQTRVTPLGQALREFINNQTPEDELLGFDLTPERLRSEIKILTSQLNAGETLKKFIPQNIPYYNQLSATDKLMVVYNLLQIIEATGGESNYALDAIAKICKTPAVIKDNIKEVVSQLAQIARAVGETVERELFSELSKILSRSCVTEDNIVGVLIQITQIAQAAKEGEYARQAFSAVDAGITLRKGSDNPVTNDNAVSVLSQFARLAKAAGRENTFDVVFSAAMMLEDPGITKGNVVDELSQITVAARPVVDASPPVPTLREEPVRDVLKTDFIEETKELMEREGIRPPYARSTKYSVQPEHDAYWKLLDFFIKELENLPFNNEMGKTLLQRGDARDVVARLIDYVRERSEQGREARRWPRGDISKIRDIFSEDWNLEVFKNEIHSNMDIEGVAYSVDLGKGGGAGFSVILDRFIVKQGPLRVARAGSLRLFLGSGELEVNLEEGTLYRPHDAVPGEEIAEPAVPEEEIVEPPDREIMELLEELAEGEPPLAAEPQAPELVKTPVGAAALAPSAPRTAGLVEPAKLAATAVTEPAPVNIPGLIDDVAKPVPVGDESDVARTILLRMLRDNPANITGIVRSYSDVNAGEEPPGNAAGSYSFDYFIEIVVSKTETSFQEVLDEAMKLLGDNDKNVRGFAARALGLMAKEKPEIVPRLFETLNTGNETARESAALAFVIAAVRSSNAVSAKVITTRLREALADENKDVRENISRALSIVNARVDPGIVSALVGDLTSEDVNRKIGISLTLVKISEFNSEEIITHLSELIEALNDENSQVRSNIAKVLRELTKSKPGETIRVIPALINALEDKDETVQGHAAMAIGNIARNNSLDIVKAEPNIGNILKKHLTSTNETIRLGSVRGINHIAYVRPDIASLAIPELRKTLNDSSKPIILNSAVAFRHISSNNSDVVIKAVPELIDAFTTDDEKTREEIAATLEIIALDRPEAVLGGISSFRNVLKDKSYENTYSRRRVIIIFKYIALQKFKETKEVLSDIVEALNDDDENARDYAGEAFSAIAIFMSDNNMPELIDLLNSENDDVRNETIRVLSELVLLGKLLPHSLLDMIEDPENEEIRQSLIGVLELSLETVVNQADGALDRVLAMDGLGENILKYARYYRNLARGVSVTEGLDIEEAFPYLSKFREHMNFEGKGEGKKLLVVHNIKDGLGDELIRMYPLLQAIMDEYPELEITIYTDTDKRKIYQKSDKIHIRDIRNFHDEREYDMEFDMVINHSHPNSGYDTYYHKPLLFDGLIARAKPKIYIKTDKKTDDFEIRSVEMEGIERKLTIPRGASVYTPTSRLIAELGLSVRFGTQKPKGRSLLLGEIDETDEGVRFLSVAGNDAYRWWRDKVDAKREARDVIFYTGFGGESEAKGLSFDRMVEDVRALVRAGNFVIISPNDTKWGSKEKAEEVLSKAVEGLSGEEKNYVIISPGPKGTPDVPNAGELIKFWIEMSNHAVIIEGGSEHLSGNLGSPFTAGTTMGSGPPKWHSPFRAKNQIILGATATTEDVVESVKGEEEAAAVAKAPVSVKAVTFVNDDGSIGRLDRSTKPSEAIESQEAIAEAIYNQRDTVRRLQETDVLAVVVINDDERLKNLEDVGNADYSTVNRMAERKTSPDRNSLVVYVKTVEDAYKMGEERNWDKTFFFVESKIARSKEGQDDYNNLKNKAFVWNLNIPDKSLCSVTPLGFLMFSLIFNDLLERREKTELNDDEMRPLAEIMLRNIGEKITKAARDEIIEKVLKPIFEDPKFLENYSGKFSWNLPKIVPKDWGQVSRYLKGLQEVYKAL